MKRTFLAILPLLVITCGRDNPINPKLTDDQSTVIHTYGGGSRDIGRSLAQTSDGGYAVTGYSASNDGDFMGLHQGSYDIFILKVDANGNQQWIKTVGGSKAEEGFSMAHTSDGGFAVTGYTGSNDGDFTGLHQGSYDIFILKLDSNGNQQWLKTFGGSGHDRGYSLTQTSDGGYAVTGFSRSSDGDLEGLNQGIEDIFILKVDAYGDKQWIKSYGGSSDEMGFSMTQTSDDGYTITGWSESNDGDFAGLNIGGYDIFILKVDSNGNQQWIKTVGGNLHDYGYSLTQTSSGGYAITGWSASNDGIFKGLNHGEDDIFILKVDAKGNQQWLKTFGGGAFDNGYSLTQTMDNGYALTGRFSSDDGDFSGLYKGDTDIFLLKLDSNGNQQWVKSFGGSRELGDAYDVGYSLTQTSDGMFAITGSFGSINGDFSGLNQGASDIFILEVESDGNQQ